MCSIIVCQTSKYTYTLPETNIAPENGWLAKRKLIFQPSIFRGYVSFREGKSKYADGGLDSKSGTVVFVEALRIIGPSNTKGLRGVFWVLKKSPLLRGQDS